MDKIITDPNNKPVTSTWADDITVITSSHLDCMKVLIIQEQVSQRINLPLSPKKAQLLIIYPKDYNGKRWKVGTYIYHVQIKKHVKILGLIF